jgi:DNA-binding MarR family transcriptional regulator
LPEADTDIPTWFAIFNEMAILNQLSTALFERRLPDGFLVSHFAVLNHLVRLGDGRTPLSMARAFQVPKATMTHTLTKLEKSGLVRLAPNPKDGRSKCVFLTDEGRAFRDRAIAALEPDIARLSAAFPTGRIAEMLPALQELREVLDADRDRPTEA